MLNFAENNKFAPDSSVSILDLYGFCFDINTSTEEVLMFFKKEHSIPGVIITSMDKYINLLSRRMLFDVMTQPFSQELFLKKSIKNIFNGNKYEALIINSDTLISEATRIVLQRTIEYIYEPIIVAFGDCEYKVLDIDQLLIAQSKVHLVTVNQLKKNIRYVDTLLNNSGEGYLTFKGDLLIEKKYSNECRLIFERDIEDLDFPSLISPNDLKMQEFLNKIFRRLLEKDDQKILNLYMPLLPDEFKISNKYITARYKIIVDYEDNVLIKRFMVILNNITDKKILESKIEEEHIITKMVMSYILNHNTVMELIEDYKIFYSKDILNILNGNEKHENKIYEIFRLIHTFKGNFSQFDFVTIPKHLDKVESEISDYINKKVEMSVTDLELFFMKFNFSEWMEHDIKIIKGYLGDDYWSNTRLVLPLHMDLYRSIESKIRSLPENDEKGDLLREYKKISQKSFKELLVPYIHYVQKISNKMNKSIIFENIEGEDIMIEPNDYKNFCKSLVHVFRNIVDHAIEPMEIRVGFSKDINGHIKCSVNKNDGYIYITISDDGNGIDVEKIKRVAVQKNMHKEGELDKLSIEEIYNMIFLDNFSTIDKPSKLSGRGMGLSTVKKETDRLNGRIIINSAAGKGTIFTFILPIKNS
jgi:two-component system, chemotaxis family, sensor kinase CheA